MTSHSNEMEEPSCEGERCSLYTTDEPCCALPPKFEEPAQTSDPELELTERVVDFTGELRADGYRADLSIETKGSGTSIRFALWVNRP